MRSLKIIVFRDTDKPYTVIIPSSLLVLTAFVTVALVSLLTYSVIANALLAGGMAAVPTASEPAAEEGGELVPVEEPAGEESGTTGRTAQAQEGVESGTASEQTQPLEEKQPWEAFEAADNPFTVNALGGPAGVGGGVQLQLDIRVKDRFRDGQLKNGRYIVALLDEDMIVGAVYPESARIESEAAVSPLSGASFSIRTGNIYQARFQGADLSNYAAYVVLVYREETQELLWKSLELIQ
jgi:hypothetical protein